MKTIIAISLTLVLCLIFTGTTEGRSPSYNGYALIKQFEGLYLTAYQDSGGVWTIGYGTTRYPGGSKVKRGDRISAQQADEIFRSQINSFAAGVDSALGSTPVDQNQFDALVSFSYNVGLGALRRSTLLSLVKSSPNNPAIRNEFMRWNKVRGRVVRGLTNRRAKEADLYFS